VRKIKISAGPVTIRVQLLETPTAEAIYQALPFRSSVKTWGEEVYFAIPVEATLEADAEQVVDPGTVCFWVEGSSLAIPFGPTPISVGDECRLAARVNLLGTCEGNPKVLGTVNDGDAIRVERVEPQLRG